MKLSCKIMVFLFFFFSLAFSEAASVPGAQELLKENRELMDAIEARVGVLPVVQKNQELMKENKELMDSIETLVGDPVVGEDFTIEFGMEFCEFDSNGCITDGSDDYGNNERCTITVNRDGVLDVKELDTDINYYSSDRQWDCYDNISIKGKQYCGFDGFRGKDGDPNGLSVSNGDKIGWNTDGGWVGHGFVICLNPIEEGLSLAQENQELLKENNELMNAIEARVGGVASVTEIQELLEENKELMDAIETRVGGLSLAQENQELQKENKELMDAIEARVGEVALAQKNQKLKKENAKLMNAIEARLGAEVSLGCGEDNLELNGYTCADIKWGSFGGCAGYYGKQCEATCCADAPAEIPVKTCDSHEGCVACVSDLRDFDGVDKRACDWDTVKGGCTNIADAATASWRDLMVSASYNCPDAAVKERAVANSDVIEQVVLTSDWKQMFVVPLAIVGIIGSISFLWKLFSRGFKNPIYTEIHSAEV